MRPMTRFYFLCLTITFFPLDVGLSHPYPPWTGWSSPKSKSTNLPTYNISARKTVPLLFHCCKRKWLPSNGRCFQSYCLEPVRYGGVLLSAPLHTSVTLHNLLNVPVQFANKMGFYKKKIPNNDCSCCCWLSDRFIVPGVYVTTVTIS
jgi:hypothetical protein